MGRCLSHTTADLVAGMHIYLHADATACKDICCEQVFTSWVVLLITVANQHANQHAIQASNFFA